MPRKKRKCPTAKQQGSERDFEGKLLMPIMRVGGNPPLFFLFLKKEAITVKTGWLLWQKALLCISILACKVLSLMDAGSTS